MPLAITRLGEFFFLYPPHVKRTYKRIGAYEIKLIGAASSASNLRELREVCESVGPKIFRDRWAESEVVVKHFRSKGLRYWIELLEYTALEMMIHYIKDGSSADIGRTMFHPRFELHLPSDKISTNSLWLLRWSIRVKVDKELFGRFLFDDLSSEAKLGIRASVGNDVKFYAGYEDKLEEIYSGKISRLRHTLKGNLDFAVESNVPDAVLERPQTLVYHLKPNNVFSFSALTSVSGLTRKVTVPGLPSLRPNDQIQVFSTHPDFESRSFYLADEVVHYFTRDEGFVTKLTLNLPSPG